MSLASILSKLSNFFFFSGFVVSKLQFLQLTLITSILKLISLSLYMTGYGIWFISSLLHPNQSKKNQEWYSFAEFKEQFIYAASFGMVASILSIIAIFVPVLIIPASWTFFMSNVIWTIGEYHKLNNPPVYDENFSHRKQSTYISYAITMSTIGFFVALSTTLAFVFPPIAAPTLLISAIICIGLGTLAAEFWLESNLGEPPITVSLGNSYKQIKNSLGPTNSVKLKNSPIPYHGDDLLKSKQNSLPKEALDNTEVHSESFTPNK